MQFEPPEWHEHLFMLSKWLDSQMDTAGEISIESITDFS